jgi:hypothetical protein
LEKLRQKAEADAAARSEADARLAEALKAAEAVKIGERESQARAAATLAAMTARAEAAEASLRAAGNEGSGHDAEMSQLRAELERQRFELEMDSLSSKVALEAKAADALKVAEAEWQARVDAVVKAASERAEQAEKALAEARAASRPNADHEMTLNQLRRELEHQRLKAQAEIAAAHARADAKRADTDAALAAMAARAERAEALAAGVPNSAEQEIAANQLRKELEHQRLKSQSELAVANAALEARMGEVNAAKAEAAIAKAEAAKFVSEREAEMTQLRAELEQKGKAAKGAVAQLKQAAERESAEKLKAAESRWEKEKAGLLAEMAERTEAAEAIMVRARRLDAAKADDDAYVHSLEREVKSLRATLADREISLVQNQAMQEHVRLGTVRETPGGRWQPLTGPVGGNGDSEEDIQRQKSRRQMVRDIGIVMAVAIAAVLLFPRLEGMLPDTLRWQIETLGGTMVPGTTEAPAPAPAPQPAASVQPKTEHPVMYAARAVNVRAEPSVGASIAANLKRGAQVSVLEKRGNWDQVEVAPAPGAPQTGGQPAPPQQGWVFNSYLTDTDPGTN